MPRPNSQCCDQKQWQSQSKSPRKSSRSSSHHTNERSKDQRKRFENKITKYRNAARTGEYNSNDNRKLSFVYGGNKKRYNGSINNRRNTKERIECTNNLERKMSGGLHFRYKDVPPCDEKSSQCTSQHNPNQSKCRPSIQTNKAHPCQGDKRLKSPNQRKYSKTNHDYRKLEKCMCSEKPNEKEKAVSCKERERSEDICKLRETCDENGKYIREIKKHYDHQCEEELYAEQSTSKQNARSRNCTSSPKKHHIDRMNDMYHEDKEQYYKKYNKDFERNCKQLSSGVTNKDSNQRRQEKYNERRQETQDDCNQRKQEDEESDENCPIKIRLTARFTPSCINDRGTTPTEPYRDDETCCSCCSDDEDSFHTPDCFTASLRDMRAIAKPCNEESKSNSSESTSNGTCNQEPCPPIRSKHLLVRGEEERPGEYFDKAAKLEETKEQLRRPGFCKYILSPFGSNSTLEDNKYSRNTVVHKRCDYNPETESNNSKETEMYHNFCKEIQSLRKEIDRIKCSHQEKQLFSRSEVDCLIKENQSLKKELDEFKNEVEEQFHKMLEEKFEVKAHHVEICRKNAGIESSCGDKSELSQGYNEVLDVVTEKLHGVLKRFQKEEKAVCERSTSFNKFTSNYRCIIEDYCRTLSKRITEWFECQKRRCEKREEKLKQEYIVCCSFMENEKETIKSKVNKINEKIDQYEKYIEWQMKFIQSKYIPDSTQGTPEAGATRSGKTERTEWSDILDEPNCTSKIRRQIDDRNNHCYIKPRHQTSHDDCRGISTNTLYSRNKCHSSKPKKRERSRPCSESASADHFTYTVSHEQTYNFPFQEKVHGEEKTHGKYSIMNKIKEYFDKGHKKPKDYPERTLSVMTFNSDNSECTTV
ncbi:hypothetical protein WDU94_012730 [Cyamophila willieti]